MIPPVPALHSYLLNHVLRTPWRGGGGGSGVGGGANLDSIAISNIGSHGGMLFREMKDNTF